MSSSYVRSTFYAYLDSQTAEELADMTGAYEELQDFLASKSITGLDPWIGITYLGHEELPVTVQGTAASGMFRETGAIYIHVVEISSSTAVASILSRAETLRNILRSKRISNIVIVSVTPPNFEHGATLDLEGGYTSASFIVEYFYDKSA